MAKITHHMYMGALVDEKKVDESAHRRANDRYKPSSVLVHYHKYNEPCAYRETIPDKLDDKHKMFLSRKDKEAKDV